MRWKDVRKEQNITVEDENVMEIEHELIWTIVSIREEQAFHKPIAKAFYVSLIAMLL